MPLRYKALNPNTDEIRLLRRLPSRDNILHFSLETFSLRAAPPFWAFSYVWGDPKKTSRIVVNNHNFHATENLVAALTTHVHDILELRADLPHHSHFQAQHLWADAVCINQRDEKERAHQVSRMRDIYQKGIVCIYLNTSDRDAYKSVHDALQRLSETSAGDSTPRISPDMRYELLQFFSKDWFHRMWMIQEFVLAESKPLFFFLGGHKGITERDLRDAAWAVFQKSSDLLPVEEEFSLLSGVKQYMCLAEVKDRIKDDRECSFLTLLWTFRDRLASDPRDKVYSLLGLLRSKLEDDQGRPSSVVACDRGLAFEELIVDYKATVEDVYASVVKSAIIGMDSLNVLCACQRPGRFERSWVPDWTEPWSRFSLLTNSIGLVPDGWRKNSFTSSAGQKPVVEFSRDMQSITVEGVLSSKVSVLGDQPANCANSRWIEDWFTNVEQKLKIQISLRYEVNLQNVSDPFIQSVVATNTEEDGIIYSDVLAAEYSLPFTGASLEWKEMVRFYREDTLSKEEAEMFIIDIRIAQMLNGRRVFIGENGYCGIVPDHTHKGDLICVLFGCDVPVVLRQEAEHFTFIGECYALGLMYGEAIEAVRQGSIGSKQFVIF
ncbi:heterokaryon incompatibility protein-domain-containing protein [Paraphoma chrysanthemicola]|uniref:Heterokaryon incompatibility protein-domain-containing protein n=1 Tax=Paraphoma chrysanthemicola TaxID=798071 RepID=A0A8K0RAH0_9PLEO|nr:heterokaryon incompatibility protein-domain-containing protein [Paraphoma chrysanthemicola]